MEVISDQEEAEDVDVAADVKYEFTWETNDQSAEIFYEGRAPEKYADLTTKEVTNLVILRGTCKDQAESVGHAGSQDTLGDNARTMEAKRRWTTTQKIPTMETALKVSKP